MSLFLIGYAAVRFAVEFVRQPDPQFRGPGDPVGVVLGPFTMGQVISTVMMLIGLGLLLGVARSARSAIARDPRA